jgi:hypothetical protein
MLNKLVLITLLLAGLLAGCNLTAQEAAPTTNATATPTLEFVEPVSPTSPIAVNTITPAAPVPTEQAMLDRAAEVVAALKDKDMARLSAYVDPQLGLRFSPYAVVKDTDLVFPVDTVAGLMADTTVFTWGAYQATGEPIELTFADYYASFIYDVDFASAPQVALNHRLGVSTTMDNSHEFYPNAMIVEYYFPGFDPQLEGMDWRSLRLVFQQTKDTWYLVGIIHDQWTT